MTEINPQATIKCRASMSGVVVRGPSGEYGEPGSTEPLEFQGGSEEQIVELTYEQAVELVGEEKATQLFKGANLEGGDFSE